MQLRVIKADGSVEEYLHTKVLGTFSNALGLVDEPNVFAAEQFADAVTFHLYGKRNTAAVNSDRIHLMVQAVLAATGYEHAAQALNDYHLKRKLKRKRIEVINTAENAENDYTQRPRRWSKSQIVNDLVEAHITSRPIARAIAATVEEKVLNISMARVPRSLIKQLVIADTDAMLQAERQLEVMS